MFSKIITQLKNRKPDRENANLILFCSGKSISLFGSAIYAFAVGLYLLKITGSGLTFATNIVLYTLPIVFVNPIAGVIADRIDKKKVIVGSDLLNGIFLLIVFLLANEIGLSLPLVYTSTFVMTVLATFFNIGIESAKPNLVSKEKLVDINSIARVIESGSSVIGPMLGGIIYAFINIKLFILINAISFLIAAILEYFIDYQYNKTRESDKIQEKSEDAKEELKNNIWFEMKEGYQYIFSRQHTQALVYIFTALNFFLSYAITVPLPYLLNTIWKVDASIYGIVQGGFPVGMIIGALLVKKVMERVSYSKLLKRINYSINLGVLAFGIPLIINNSVPDPVFILIYYTTLMVLNGIIISWVDVPLSVLLQQMVPGRILGRVISVSISIVKIIVPIALILSGYLVNLFSPLILFLTGAFLFTLFNIWFFNSPLGKNFINVSHVNMTSTDL